MKNAFVLAATLLFFSLSAHAEQPTTRNIRFVQDRFAIGIWVTPQGQPIAKHYKDLADANFTLVIGSDGIAPAAQLELCNRLNLRAIVRADGPADKLPDGPACWGYLLTDEPGAGAFPDLAKRADDIRKSHPGRFGYVNLFPNYAPQWALGTKTYDEHVAKFVAEVKPEVLSM